MIKLYGIGPSRWIRPYWMLKELGLEFEEVITHPREDREELLKLNPFGKVPVLEDGDFTLYESPAICVYLADTYGEGKFMPAAGTRERALVGQWISFTIMELESVLFQIAKHTFIYPEEKRSEEAIERAREDFLKLAAPLEQLVGDKDVLVGDSFSVADLLMAQVLLWAGRYELLADFPGLVTYRDRHISRPAFPMHLYETKT